MNAEEKKIKVRKDIEEGIEIFDKMVRENGPEKVNT